MKKTFKIFLMSLVFLTLCSIVGYFTKYANFKDVWGPLVIAAPILLLSIILSIIGKYYKTINIVSFVMNAVALGFCIRAWYILRNFDNSLWIMLAISVVASSFIWLFYLFSFLPGFDSHPITDTLLFALIFLVFYIILVAKTKTTFVSTLGYYLIIELGFLFASLAAASDNWKLFRNISLSTFSVIAVAIIIAIIAGSGDFDIDISGLDFPCETKKRKRKKL